MTPNATNATFVPVTDLIGPGEAARRLGVTPRTVQRWLRSGRMRSVRVGQRLKVDASALAEVAASPGNPDVRRIGRLLVANRGELPVRIGRTCRRLGIACIGLVAEAKEHAWWASQLDETIAISTGYLDGAAIVRAALDAGADALHPGYGFLAESADFADAVEAAGIAWVGPPPAAMRVLGDKAAARRLAQRIGLPVLTGYEGRGQSDATLAREADRIGFPLIVKPSAGGGGKGMHVVRARSDLRATLATARREARGAFADERLVLERYLDRPRHVEVQILFDRYGNGVHLGERDCSLQRRHQKVIEESPAPAVTATLRRDLGAAAVRLAAEAGYIGAGTVEFLLDDDGRFYFLEMNARLQVEHPVTELVTGRDLVADQIRLAAGDRLRVEQRDIALNGHAIEARIYAEDPWAGFVPATGTVRLVRWPEAPGIRVDAGVGPGDEVGTRYDPMLAKVIASASNRRDTLATLDSALDELRVAGVTTNRGFLRALLKIPEVRAGDARTDTIAIRWHPGAGDVPDWAWQAAARAIIGAIESDVPVRPGFRLNAQRTIRLASGDVGRVVPLDRPRFDSPASVALAGDGRAAFVDVEGRSVEIRLASAPSIEAAASIAAGGSSGAVAVTAPMPGTVLGVRVALGATVERHDVLVLLEAMKMENAVTAPGPGRVARVLAKAGQPVQRGETLVELA